MRIPMFGVYKKRLIHNKNYSEMILNMRCMKRIVFSYKNVFKLEIYISFDNCKDKEYFADSWVTRKSLLYIFVCGYNIFSYTKYIPVKNRLSVLAV